MLCGLSSCGNNGAKVQVNVSNFLLLFFNEGTEIKDMHSGGRDNQCMQNFGKETS